MALTAYWTQFAEDKLEDVFTYYSKKASEKVALRLVDGIIAKSLELEKNPLIGQKELLLADRPQEFRYLVFKNYKIIYFVNLEKLRIEVVNLFDCRQNPEKVNEI
jgi:plasmid stabilization system protein ParE